MSSLPRTTRHKSKYPGSSFPYIDAFQFYGTVGMCEKLYEIYGDRSDTRSLRAFRDDVSWKILLEGVRDFRELRAGHEEVYRTVTVGEGCYVFGLPGQWGLWTMGRDFERSYAVDNPLTKHVRHLHKFSPITHR